MIIHDPLYGSFTLSDTLAALVQTPEVRRLSQVRLLNTLTPSLAALGEVRRFSHTLGVLALVQQCGYLNARPFERQAFAAAVLIHDIGTPPFGHLFEYHLGEKTGWNHESVIKAILWGSHVRENRAHQIYGRRPIGFRTALRKSKIDLSLVEAIVAREHPLSSLLFGSVDFDNLDNVARMSWYLGISGGPLVAKTLAKHLSLIDARIALDRKYESTVQKWADLRQAAYDIIVFDPTTVAAQAVLSDALQSALERDILGEDDWVFTDEQLIDALLEDPVTKQSISARYLGVLPEMAYHVQIKGTLRDLAVSDRGMLKKIVEESLRKEFGSGALGYIFVDNGTFSKELQFAEERGVERWCLGSRSQSVILYGFVTPGKRITTDTCSRALDDALSALSVSSDSIMHHQLGPNRTVPDAQHTLDLAAPTY